MGKLEKDKAALQFEDSLLHILRDSFPPGAETTGDGSWMDYVAETTAWIQNNSPGLWTMIQAQSNVSAFALLNTLQGDGELEQGRVFKEIAAACIIVLATIRFKLEKEHGTFTSPYPKEEDL